MMILFFWFFLVASSLILWGWFQVQSAGSKRTSFPPGPRALPIIGNLHQIGRRPPYISLAEFSKEYGPLMQLKFGSLHVVVASSVEMARQVLQKQDQFLSGRVVPLAMTHYDYHKHSMLTLPAGGQWRLLRKICKEHLFSTRQLDASEGLRQEKMEQLREYVSDQCGHAVDIGQLTFNNMLSLMSEMLVSKDMLFTYSPKQFRQMALKLVDVFGSPHLADLFPALKVFNNLHLGVKLKSDQTYGKILGMFEDIINRRLSCGTMSATSPHYSASKDLLQVLLDFTTQGTDVHFKIDHIKYLLLDLLVAGTDTTSLTIEWAITELLRNPEKMSKLRDELQSVVGQHDLIKESDISRLPYLQAVVKETLRCHPAGPMLVPHKAVVDTEINGYKIRKDSLVLVNIWAITTDPSIWTNPNSFEPERFAESGIDYGGQHFELIPFGSGRRMCPGLPQAHRVIHLILASLIKDFEWKLEQGQNTCEIDMTVKPGMAMRKLKPLKCVPFKLA